MSKVDLERPIEHVSGGVAVVLCIHDSHIVIAYHDKDLGTVGFRFETPETAGNRFRNVTCDNAETIVEPAIDWTKDVQIAGKDENIWTDFIPIFVNKNHVYGHSVNGGVEVALIWPFNDWRFRNKPAEPKRVQGWVNIYLATLYKDKADAHRVAGSCRLACMEVDVPEGYGLGDDE